MTKNNTQYNTSGSKIKIKKDKTKLRGFPVIKSEKHVVQTKNENNDF